jgi:hypothetical protein
LICIFGNLFYEIRAQLQNLFWTRELIDKKVKDLPNNKNLKAKNGYRQDWIEIVNAK